MKKDRYNYFETFIKTSNYALEGAKKLDYILNNFKKSELAENIKQLHTLENKADVEKHIMSNYLLKDFLPPIDREDILILSHRIDDVMDYIDEILINIDILNIDKLRHNVPTFSNLLVECCQTMTEMVKELANLKKIEKMSENVVKINRLEEKGDALYIASMKELYKNRHDPIEVMAWTTIYNCFEECFDACEKVADYAEEIIMKNT